MTVKVEIADLHAAKEIFDEVFSYFEAIDKRFSTYKEESEISKINRGEISQIDYSREMREIFALAEEIKQKTNGYFDITTPSGKIDPSGIVKGWAIYNASKLIEARGFNNFYVDAGGDIQTKGKNSEGKPWRIGIKNPFHPAEVIKVVSLDDKGIATSGTYIRGEHIYNPKNENKKTENDIVSFTVIGPNIYEADIFATAVFAMGREGIMFIEHMLGFEGYMIDNTGIATMTTGFEKYVAKD